MFIMNPGTHNFHSHCVGHTRVTMHRALELTPVITTFIYSTKINAWNKLYELNPFSWDQSIQLHCLHGEGLFINTSSLTTNVTGTEFWMFWATWFNITTANALAQTLVPVDSLAFNNASSSFADHRVRYQFSFLLDVTRVSCQKGPTRHA